MRKKISNILLSLVLLVGLGLLLYPTVSNQWNKAHQTVAIARYEEEIKNIDTSQAEAMIEEARAYNAQLAQASDPQSFVDENKDTYNRLLSTEDSGIMGYIEVPKIKCSLPVYHGSDDDVLQVAVGHVEWTSLPVGGAGSHSVLSGHRGLPSAKLFTDLDQMEEGDIFVVHILGEDFYYEVDQIKVVLPEETESLMPVAGEDYCTLVTCTPYGINSHRLLVRGKRIEYDKTFVGSINSEARVYSIWLVSVVSGVIALIGYLISVLLLKRNQFQRKS